MDRDQPMQCLERANCGAGDRGSTANDGLSQFAPSTLKRPNKTNKTNKTNCNTGRKTGRNTAKTPSTGACTAHEQRSQSPGTQPPPPFATTSNRAFTRLRRHPEIDGSVPLHAIAERKLVFWVIQTAITVAFRLEDDPDSQQFFVGDRCVAATAERYDPR